MLWKIVLFLAYTCIVHASKMRRQFEFTDWVSKSNKDNLYEGANTKDLYEAQLIEDNIEDPKPEGCPKRANTSSKPYKEVLPTSISGEYPQYEYEYVYDDFNLLLRQKRPDDSKKTKQTENYLAPRTYYYQPLYYRPCKYPYNKIILPKFYHHKKDNNYFDGYNYNNRAFSLPIEPASWPQYDTFDSNYDYSKSDLNRPITNKIPEAVNLNYQPIHANIYEVNGALPSPESYKNLRYSHHRRSLEDSEAAPQLPDYILPSVNKLDYDPMKGLPFIESLQNFDKVSRKIMSQLFSKKRLKDQKKRYAALLAVIEGMNKIMAYSPWRNYDREYESKALKIFKYSRIDPHLARSQIRCINKGFRETVSKLRNIIENKWIKYICQNSEAACDTVVFAVIDASNDAELQRDARLLLALGRESSLFLEKYADELEEKSKLYDQAGQFEEYVVQSREFLKPLIKAGSEARTMLPDSVVCYDDMSGRWFIEKVKQNITSEKLKRKSKRE